MIEALQIQFLVGKNVRQQEQACIYIFCCGPLFAPFLWGRLVAPQELQDLWCPDELPYVPFLSSDAR